MCGVWFDQEEEEEEEEVVSMFVQTQIELRLHIPAAVGPSQLGKTGGHAQTHMLQDDRILSIKCILSIESKTNIEHQRHSSKNTLSKGFWPITK